MAIEMYASAASEAEDPWGAFTAFTIQDFRKVAWAGALHEASLYLNPDKTTKDEIEAWLHVMQIYAVDNPLDHKGFRLLAQFNAVSGDKNTANKAYERAVKLAYAGERSLAEKAKTFLAAAKHYTSTGQINTASGLYEFMLKADHRSPDTIELVVDFYMDVDRGNNRARALEILQNSPKKSIKRNSLRDILKDLSTPLPPPPEVPPAL